MSTVPLSMSCSRCAEGVSYQRMVGCFTPSSSAIALTTYSEILTSKPLIFLSGCCRPTPGWSNLVPRMTVPPRIDPSSWRGSVLPQALTSVASKANAATSAVCRLLITRASSSRRRLINVRGSCRGNPWRVRTSGS
ncbi:Uncharacterised protein [Mycobacteroides abscessus subsp. abscessus]|nr:Uncharacterised protein [Mycobacteroides abscessus subsp. abscessus]